MGSQDLQELVRARHREEAENLKKSIEGWKHHISVTEKLLEDSTRMFEKYGDETSKRFMESDAENLAFARKLLAEDMKLLDAFEVSL